MRQLPKFSDLIISVEKGAGGEDILISLPILETAPGIPPEELKLRAWEKLTGGILDRLEALRGRLCDNTPTAIAINKIMEELKAG